MGLEMELLTLPTPPGPLREPWKATWWVQLFEKLGPEFPSPEASEDVWERFVSKCSTVPVVLLAVGVLTTLTVLCCSCLCRPRARDLGRRPSSKPTCCVGLLTLALIAAGTLIHWQTATRALDTVQTQLDHAISDCATASDEGARLQQVAPWLTQDLDDVPSTCVQQLPPQVRQAVEGQLTSLKQQVAEYGQQVSSYYSQIQPVPEQLDKVKTFTRWLAVVTKVGLLVPMALVLLCCMAVLDVVVCSHSGRCSLCCVRCLGPLLFAPTVVLVAAAAAVQLEVGVVASSFCAEVDMNALAYIGHSQGTGSMAYKLSSYYITESGANPLLQDLKDAREQLRQADASVAQFSGLLGQQCPQWRGGLANLTASLAEAQAGIGVGERLLSWGNVYPYYEKVVRQDACQTTVVGLGWLVCFQVLVGLLCLPWLVALAMRYLKAKHIWSSSALLSDPREAEMGGNRF